nr:autotransporter outer membrane beta-barrel domain-containing protein [Conchiformibius kuhniae]
MTHSFPLTPRPMALAVAAAFALPQAHALETVCEHENGCEYTYHSNADREWHVRTPAASGTLNPPAGEKLHIRLKAQDYQNVPATGTGIQTTADGKDYALTNPKRLIAVQDWHRDAPSAAELTVPTGSKLTLARAEEDSSAVHVGNAHATLEQGVRISLNPGYGEANRLSHPHGDTWDTGTAIRATNGAQVRTSADIDLHGTGASGLHADDLNTRIEAADHQINLHAPVNIALSAADGGKIHARRVHIRGNGDAQLGLHTVNDGDFGETAVQHTEIRLDDSSVKLPGKTTAVIMAHGGKSILNNSSTEAEAGIVQIAFPDDTNNQDTVIDLHNSTLHGRRSLLAVNPPAWMDVAREPVPDQANRFHTVINAANSTLHGDIRTDRHLRRDNQAFGTYTLNLRDNSTWTLNGDSTLDTLNVQDSTVAFAEDGGFKTLEVSGELSGNATFRLNTDLANAQGDKLLVHGKASGQHTLHIRNTPAEPAHTDGKLTVVQTGGSDADTFRLHGETVSAGKYLYELQQENGKDWVLAHHGETAAPPAGKPLPAPSAITTPHKVLGVYADSRIAHAQTASQVLTRQNESLNLRLAELHNPHHLNGLWVLSDHSTARRPRQHIDGNTKGITSGNRTHTNGFQIGYDHVFASGAYVGALAGRSVSAADYRRQGFPDSRVSTNTFGAYGGFTRNGWFGDVLLRHNRHHSRHPEEHNRWHGNSLMLQTGMQFDAGYGWRVVPQAALTLARMSRSPHTKVAVLAQTRIGAELRGDFLVSERVRVMPFAGLYHLGDHRPAAAKLDNEYLQAPKAGSRAALHGGASVAFDRNH